MTDTPYGLQGLDSPIKHDTANGLVLCPVIGCQQWLEPPARKPKFAGKVCPDHGIRVHRSGTYTYADYRRNLVIDAEFFAQHIRHHPWKYECWRFGSECSEDCLSWVVFRSMQQAGLLGEVVRLCTGIEASQEPRLFLWGLELLPEGVEPWDLLIGARERFESDLPVQRPKTEPDIALHVPGEVLILIEAKFTSKNPVYRRDRAKLLDLTIDQLVQIYQWPGMRLIDPGEAQTRETLLYQLYRNAVFADYQSQLDSPTTRGYVINLVREGQESCVCDPMLTLMPTSYRDRFDQISWEQLFQIASRAGEDRLCRYMLNKTARLKPAFNLPSR